jgi:hypothetical protein
MRNLVALPQGPIADIRNDAMLLATLAIERSRELDRVATQRRRVGGRTERNKCRERPTSQLRLLTVIVPIRSSMRDDSSFESVGIPPTGPERARRHRRQPFVNHGFVS